LQAVEVLRESTQKVAVLNGRPGSLSHLLADLTEAPPGRRGRATEFYHALTAGHSPGHLIAEVVTLTAATTGANFDVDQMGGCAGRIRWSETARPRL
jgi:hypothetical protein